MKKLGNNLSKLVVAPPKPQLPSLEFLLCIVEPAEILKSIQEFINLFEYNYSGTQFVDA